MANGTIQLLKNVQVNCGQGLSLGQPFSLRTALLFAATVSTVMLLAAVLQQWLGKEGVIAVAAIAGFADTYSADADYERFDRSTNLGKPHSYNPSGFLIGVMPNF
ncbi:MAG: DUF4010 domain-containing protein [Methylomicrobium sp.]|nr:DUF4010 domain-containing protein [Methylomicrobium sp.]